MDTETIKRVIRDQEEETSEKFRTENIIEREYLSEIQKVHKEFKCTDYKWR